MDDCLSVCNLLKAAASCCERELNDSLAELEVSHCQAMILIKIVDAPASMSALSKEMCCHKSNITQVVAGLESKGLIERETKEDDRRVILLKLTAKGKTMAVNMKKIVCGRATECMNVFTPDEKKTFAELLKKYIEKHRA
jgi:DNA-binding MarR family transcriptional regulator